MEDTVRSLTSPSAATAAPAVEAPVAESPAVEAPAVETAVETPVAEASADSSYVFPFQVANESNRLRSCQRGRCVCDPPATGCPSADGRKFGELWLRRHDWMEYNLLVDRHSLIWENDE